MMSPEEKKKDRQNRIVVIAAVALHVLSIPAQALWLFLKG
jgi:hypothetical protein